MRFLSAILFIILVSAAAVFSQTNPAPSPTPVIEDDRDVVKITTNLIQIDVTVTDSKGRIVTDLKPEEIEIYENKEKQTVTNFSFINTQDRTLEKRDPAAAKNAPPIPSTPLRPDQVKRTIALVVDDLSLSFESAYYVRRALKKFVDEQMQMNDVVAIIRTGSGIGALQQFTSDRRQLYAAIERVKWNPLGRGGITAFAPLETARDFSNSSMDRSVQTDVAMDADDREAETELTQFREDIFAVGTLGAVNYVVRGMRTLPGRKSIILFSEGFRLRNDMGVNTRVVTSLRLLSDMANRASVVIYTMDPRGLQYLGLTAADSTSDLSFDDIQSRLDDRRNKFLESQLGLSYLAQVTGGTSIKNTNDLSKGIERILDDQKGYYLIGYQPDEATFDPAKRRFNRLTVKVTRPGLKVRYRSGFFGVSDSDIRPVPRTPREQIMAALTSPFSTGEITVKLVSLFSQDLKQGSVVTSLVFVKASDLKFSEEADGWHKTVFDIVAVAFGDNGQVVDHLARTETLRVRNELYDKVRKEGIVYNVQFPMKKAGAYQMRIAVRDTGTAKIGSANQFVEVPALKKERFALSGVILENLGVGGKKVTTEKPGGSPDFARDTALRQFKPGSVLSYSFLVYNPKLERTTGKPQLQTQVKLFKDGNEIFTGKTNDFVPGPDDKPGAMGISGAVQLGTAMEPGDYVMQILVTDMLVKGKSRVKAHWLDFEIVK